MIYIFFKTTNYFTILSIMVRLILCVISIIFGLYFIKRFVNEDKSTFNKIKLERTTYILKVIYSIVIVFDIINLMIRLSYVISILCLKNFKFMIEFEVLIYIIGLLSLILFTYLTEKIYYLFDVFLFEFLPIIPINELRIILKTFQKELKKADHYTRRNVLNSIKFRKTSYIFSFFVSFIFNIISFQDYKVKFLGTEISDLSNIINQILTTFIIFDSFIQLNANNSKNKYGNKTKLTA